MASEYEKGTDTMDVWFDSGSSWAAVLLKREGFNLPADLYLEGSDQHRGWFQSSLLTSVASRGMAPYSAVVTHGFVLDEKGLKMSKSVGNVVDPQTVIDGGKNQGEAPAYGADVLRLWVSSVDYSSDVMIGPQVLRQMSDIYRKLRGTLRYLLGNLCDWKMEKTVSYTLFQLESVVKNITESYEKYQFYKIFQIIQRFVIVDLSNFYFDVAKDRLYVGFGPRESKKAMMYSDVGRLNCSVSYAPFATPVRGQVSEHKDFSSVLYKALEGSIILESFPKTTVDVFALVIESGGSDLPVIISCASLALADAGIMMYDLVTAVSMSSLGTNLIIDPLLEEESCQDGSLMLTYMPSRSEVTQLAITGEWTTQKGMKVCLDACRKLAEIMRLCLKEAASPSEN